VRDSPSINETRIGTLVRGTPVQVIERDAEGSWLEIVFPIANDQGLTGWVPTQSITLQVSVDTLPTGGTPTVTPSPSPDTTIDSPRPTEAEPAATPEHFGTQTTPERNETLAPAETSPPIPTPTSTEVAGSMPTASLPYSFTTQVQTPPYPPSTPPTTDMQTSEPSALRIGEIGSLFLALTLGAAAFYVTHISAH
jgi:Bacterial SH3 domain